MSETTPPAGPAQALCASEALLERGRAEVFEVRLWGQSARAFALRFDGRVVAYVNRCAHVPAELDWQPGEFLDQERRWIVCSIHGAVYEPTTGHCVFGPCQGKRLIPIAVSEEGGQVSWYPSRDIEPAAAPRPTEPPPPTP